MSYIVPHGVTATDCSRFCAFDICMFVQLGAKERSETMWKRLIDKVGGLQVRKFWQAPGLKGEGIVEVSKNS